MRLSRVQLPGCQGKKKGGEHRLTASHWICSFRFLQQHCPILLLLSLRHRKHLSGLHAFPFV